MLSEGMFELSAKHSCMHQRVALSKLPPYVPWVSFAHEDSRMAEPLRSLALQLQRPVIVRNRVLVVTIEDLPSESCEQVFASASRRWRQISGDQGYSNV